MKIKGLSRRKPSAYALMAVLLFSAIAILVLAATVKRSSTTAMLNEREGQFNRSYFAAEAAVEKVVGEMLSDYKQGQDAYLANNLTNYQTAIPSTAESSYWGDYEFSDGQSHVGKTYVKLIVAGKNNWLTDQTDGLSRWRTVYRVLSNVRQKNAPYNITNASQMDIAVDAIPVFQFAIFYNSNLEFTWAAPFTINGRVHANGAIYTGVSSSSSLTFNSLVSTTSTITKKALGGYTVNNMTGSETYSGGQKTNNVTLTLPVGTNNAWEMINIPPPGEDVNSTLGTNRYYNKAGMILLVSNATVTLIVQSYAGDPSPTNITYNFNSNSPWTANATTNLPFLNIAVTNFVDQRESKTNKLTQIDMGVLKTWATTNAAILNKRPPTGPNANPLAVLYVADRRSVTPNQMDAVRLTDAATLPSFGSSGGLGFTVATINPLYIQGNYNAPDNLSSTNVTDTLPASVVSDSLTILSPNWVDSKSNGALTGRTPTDTTINSAIITGTVQTTGTSSSNFSGGVHNLPRLLENWSTDVDLWLNTSIINLYPSAIATNQFQLPGNYYNAPSRHFTFDVNFMDPAKQPPGAPLIGEIKRLQWATPPADNVTYDLP